MVSIAILARGSEAVKASEDQSLITIKSATIFSDSGFCQRDKRGG